MRERSLLVQFMVLVWATVLLTGFAAALGVTVHWLVVVFGWGWDLVRP